MTHRIDSAAFNDRLGTDVDSFTDFWEAFDAFVRALNHARGRSAASTPPGELTFSQYKVLDTVVSSDAPRLGEIAAWVGIAPPTLTRMIAGLERDGFIERHAEPADGRAVCIKLTAKGRRAQQRTARRLTSRRRRIYDALPPEGREHAVAVLRALAGGMDAV